MSEEDEIPLDPQQQKTKDKIKEILSGNGPPREEVPLELDPAIAERLSVREHAADVPLKEELEDQEPEEEMSEEDERSIGRESNAFRGDTHDTSSIKALSLQMPALSREDVEPTHMDKLLYLKSMLNDEPLEFQITLRCGVKMAIRSLNNYEQDIIFRALEVDQQDKSVAGPAQYVVRMQYYAALMQITEFNKKRQDFVEFRPDENGRFMPTDEAVEILRDRTRHYIGAMNWATWQVKLTGLRIFEERLGMCNRAVLEENFWTPAGTD